MTTSGSNCCIKKFSVVISQESRYRCAHRFKKDKNIDNLSLAEGERIMTRWPKGERGDNLITAPELRRNSSNRKEASDGLRNGIE
jgi:hypothetical protein